MRISSQAKKCIDKTDYWRRWEPIGYAAITNSDCIDTADLWQLDWRKRGGKQQSVRAFLVKDPLQIDLGS